MDTVQQDALVAFKDRARATWRSGDYDAVAEGIWPVGKRIVRRVGVEDGDRVLDVAAGTGNAAIRAALAGGRVTALDLTPELFEAGRRRAAEAGADVEWVEGDAEDLPFPDSSFDVVLSTFGVMFAPRHAIAARELARVLRPGGRIGLATWTPDGTVGNVFRTLAAGMPAPPEFAGSPLAWGDPAHVVSLFAGTGVEVTCERDELAIDPDITVDEATEFYLTSFGPIVSARRMLEPDGGWEALEQRLRPVIQRFLREPASYLATIGRRASSG